MKNKKTIRWDLELSEIIGVPIKITTVDGLVREGEISSIKFYDVDIIGYICPVPHRILLGDSYDWVNLKNVEKIEFAE
jgi:hypothetical protein